MNNGEAKITIPLKLSVKDIKMLSSELNDTDNSELSIFIEEILKSADRTARKMGETARNMNSANPYSGFNCTKGANKQ
ncbi:MAG: hypothetical protein IJ207_08810 [Treponema sp.]|uniref:hypothetical protein n=1 Tax=Treponema sp. TaxID=166 RepID=UPI0025E64FB0|nr:hypothetical protein [Treponema sp.]MBQ9282282.1 hypothetical protein [Treponema sp.]